jgi:hypothetical protein
MPKFSPKFSKSEKQRQCCNTYGTYNAITLTHKTHGKNIQIQNVVELKMVTYRQSLFKDGHLFSAPSDSLELADSVVVTFEMQKNDMKQKTVSWAGR